MENLNLIRNVAWKFHHKTSIEFDELFGEAALAYSEALTKFDPDKGIKLTTFAYRCMHNHLINVCKRETRKARRKVYITDLTERSEEATVSQIELQTSAFLKKAKHIETPSDSLEDIFAEWASDAVQVADMVLSNPEQFLGNTPNYCRKKGTPKQRVKTALRQDGWTHARIQQVMREMKTAVESLRTA